MKTGRLHVIGVGPGDPELLTAKAMRLLKEVRVVCVPKGREESTSLALSIASRIVDMTGREVVEVHFPMIKTRGDGESAELEAGWNMAVEAILTRLRAGEDVAFITIGDPAIYSTFFHIHDRLLEAVPGLAVEFVPGISSITAAASGAAMPLGLGEEKIAIVPATYTEGLQDILEKFDTVVLMKVYRVFDEVKAVLDRMGLLGKTVYVERAAMADERIIRDISVLREDDMSYFSMLIVRKR